MTARVWCRDAEGRDLFITLGDEPLCIGDTRIERRGNRYWIIDAHARARLNDLPVQEGSLRHHDLIQCGDVYLRFLDVERLCEPEPAWMPARAEMELARPDLAGAIFTAPSGPDASPSVWKSRG